MKRLSPWLQRTAMICSFGLLLTFPVVAEADQAAEPTLQEQSEQPKPPRRKPRKPADDNEANSQERFQQLRQFLQELRKSNPDEFQRLIELRKSDTQAFRKEIRGKIQELHKKQTDQSTHKPQPQAQDPEILKLAEQIKATGSAKEKAALTAKLETLVAADLEKRYQTRVKRVEELEARLTKLREQMAKSIEALEEKTGTMREKLEEEAAKRDQILKNRVKRLIQVKPENPGKKKPATGE